ncbi:hypothetical protein GM921_17150 [Pedobacter sp. LMG 31464]|uniref:Uncharacterized protein n=1 Tax=Pedobacter planticolens TaxID=2679964 RepID=A0A923DZZ1_9SPHI|nr:hypothetical protein [Pedobacter planticolens]MBB2147231.1 hypothetical protein [Pedobacter planticolens]
MMKHLMTILFVLTINTTFGQMVYEPQILILAPNVTRYDKAFDKEISNYNNEIKKNTNNSEQGQALNSLDFKKQPENIQIITKSEIEFSKDLDFFKKTSFISEQFLVYRFFEKFPNLLIKLKDIKSNGTLGELKTHSEKEKLQYVLNFASIELYKENKINYAKITVQLYDNVSNSIILDKTYIGDWNNPGFEFACADKTINCTINNALSQALGEVIYTIASNSPTLKREKQLQRERFDVLMNSYFNQPFDKQLVKSIISPIDSNINVDIVYQALFSTDKSKFVAFFLEQVSAQDFKTLKDNKKDKNVNIISSKDIKDEGFLDDIPKTYGYIVKGLKYKDKWYYEKSNVTYFDAKTLTDGQQEFFSNLQQWNFFKENSTGFNSDFWETELFKKVLDLKQNPDWERYGETIWKTDEINNRPYLGLYEIVANKMRKELETENSEFNKTKEELFAQFYLKLKSKNPETYYKISEHSLIYPADKSIVINPTLITSKAGKKTIHYFVIRGNQNNVFEWTYFEPKIVTDNLYGSQVVEQISTLTEWNFSVDNLNDTEFWNKYVLLKSDDTYKYLKVIK